MNKPDDVSAEAWEEAEWIFAYECPDISAVPAIARAIDAAIAKERLACAKKLEAIADTYLPGGPMDAKSGLRLGAAALRKGA